jgi:cytochrome P450
MSTPQEPLTGTGFDATSTADDVVHGIDLTGNAAIITGGQSGLGPETTRVLHEACAHVMGPARSPDNAAQALVGNNQPIVLDPSGRDIPGEAERLRDLGPVVRVELPGGILAWAITRHELLRKVILDPQVSRDGPHHWRLWPEVTQRPEWAWIGPWIATGSMLHAYGAEHTRLRKLIAGAFTNRRAEAIRPTVEQITADLLDTLAATPSGQPVDLHTNYPTRCRCR